MNRKTICIILIMMFLAIDGWGQKSNRQLVRDDKTNLLYFETNGGCRPVTGWCLFRRA